MAPLASILLDATADASPPHTNTAGGCGWHFSLNDRRALACVCRATAAAARALAAAPGIGGAPGIDWALRGRLPSVGFSHEGGEGGVGKENQDTWFEVRPSRDLVAFGVFDGHGK
eukprot:scaffold15410_cov56-Isochrysis_galbana.AAC.1